jgi:hypothetical protein
MKNEWMYCFRCGMSHYHEQQADGWWKCPNCGATRTTPIMPKVEPEPDDLAETELSNDEMASTYTQDFDEFSDADPGL